MLNNKGNKYLCLWVAAIDGLLIQGNTLSAHHHAIHILGRDRKVRNVKILENKLSVGRIAVTGADVKDVEIRDNTFTGEGESKIIVVDTAFAEGKNNKGFSVEKHQPKKKRRKKKKAK